MTKKHKKDVRRFRKMVNRSNRRTRTEAKKEAEERLKILPYDGPFLTLWNWFLEIEMNLNYYLNFKVGTETAPHSVGIFSFTHEIRICRRESGECLYSISFGPALVKVQEGWDGAIIITTDEPMEVSRWFRRAFEGNWSLRKLNLSA